MATKVEIVVLGLLAEGPMHGYDLLERFRTRRHGFLDRAQPCLGVPGAETARARRIGRGQGAGRPRGSRPARLPHHEARDASTSPTACSDMAGELVPFDSAAGVALGFAHVVPVTVARAAADARERAVRDLLDAVRTELDRSASERDAGRAVSIAMLHQQEAMAEAELAWLKTYRASIGKVRR